MKDKDNKLCLTHDDKPPVCKNFPYYSSTEVMGHLGYTKNCGYYKKENKDASISSEAQTIDV